MPILRTSAGRRDRDGIRRAMRLAPDERGVTIVEFAFVAGPLMALMIATLQVSLTFFAQQNLETATLKASRELMTNSAPATAAAFKQDICRRLPDFMSKNCGNLYVDVTNTSNFSSANTSTTTLTYDASGNVTNSWSYSPGTTGQITTVKAFYIWQTIKGPLNFDLSTMSNGNRLLIATAVFKTEPTG